MQRLALLTISFLLLLSACTMQYRSQPRVWKPFGQKQVQQGKHVSSKRIREKKQQENQQEMVFPPMHRTLKPNAAQDSVPELVKHHLPAEPIDNYTTVLRDTPPPAPADTLSTTKTMEQREDEEKRIAKKGATGAFIATLILNVLFVLQGGEIAILIFVLLIFPLVILIGVLIKRLFQDMRRHRATPKPVPGKLSRSSFSKRLLKFTAITGGISLLLVLVGFILENFFFFWIGYGILITGAILAYMTIILFSIWLMVQLATI